MTKLVSNATRSNWKRLGSHKQLTKRANKTESEKLIFPKGYLLTKRAEVFAQRLLISLKSLELPNDVVLISLAQLLVQQAGNVSDSNKALFKKEAIPFLNQTIKRSVSPFISNAIFQTEPDVLGALYQALSAEGDRNQTGLYYTPPVVVDRALETLTDSKGTNFFDPACGSGIFLIELMTQHHVPLKDLYGMDIDPIAVALSKANLLLHAPSNNTGYPHIYQRDFLADAVLPTSVNVVGNPPWGAKDFVAPKTTILKHADSFAYFIEKCLNLLSNNQELTFVLPIAFLNIAKHQEIRKLILDKATIASIELVNHQFEGVVSDSIILTLKKQEQLSSSLVFKKGIESIDLPQDQFRHQPNFNFLPTKEIDREILNLVKQKGSSNLNESDWGLGIVTGNNTKYKLAEPTETSESLITGKDIQAFTLLKPTSFIDYHPEKYQQLAPESLYRAPEKLLYKFISKNLVFAYDNQQRLPLNSANILIPHVQGQTVKTILAFLNSSLFNYVYRILFDSPKILKTNLSCLLFPMMTKAQQVELTKLVNLQLSGDDKLKDIDQIVFNIFGVDLKQQKRIASVLEKGVFGSVEDV